MAAILVEGLDERTLERLRERARRNGRSLECEARALLEEAAVPSMEETLEAARRWRAKLGRSFSDSAELIREDRER